MVATRGDLDPHTKSCTPSDVSNLPRCKYSEFRRYDSTNLLFQVCRTLLDLIEETTVLKYHIELYADGMVDGEECELPVAERLSQLRIRRQAWKEIKWEHRRFPLIPGSWNAYELVDGIFSKTLNSIGNNTARGILFANLPSRYNTTGSLVLFEDLGITFRDFAMDPTQDLIVYMQCSRLSDPSRYV